MNFLSVPGLGPVLVLDLLLDSLKVKLGDPLCLEHLLMIEQDLVFVHGFLLDLLPNTSLNLEKLLNVILSDQSNCLPGLASPGGPAYPVNVVLGALRNVVVNYQVNIGYVQAPSCHLCGDKNALFPGLELSKTLNSLYLRHLPVYWDSIEAEGSAHQRDSQGGLAGDHEDNRLSAQILV